MHYNRSSLTPTFDVPSLYRDVVGDNSILEYVFDPKRQDLGDSKSGIDTKSDN
jgi:hypothetical protein